MWNVSTFRKFELSLKWIAGEGLLFPVILLEWLLKVGDCTLHSPKGTAGILEILEGCKEPMKFFQKTGPSFSIISRTRCLSGILLTLNKCPQLCQINMSHDVIQLFDMYYYISGCTQTLSPPGELNHDNFVSESSLSLYILVYIQLGHELKVQLCGVSLTSPSPRISARHVSAPLS